MCILYNSILKDLSVQKKHFNMKFGICRIYQMKNEVCMDLMEVKSTLFKSLICYCVTFSNGICVLSLKLYLNNDGTIMLNYLTHDPKSGLTI